MRILHHVCFVLCTTELGFENNSRRNKKNSYSHTEKIQCYPCRSGSSARGDDTEVSDVDILVEFGNDISLLDYMKIKLNLEDILNKKVDLVEYQAIKPQLRKRILSDEIRMYG